ncbi:MAG: hypothetical protein HQQ73_05150 [Desulfobulbaceae bacterium]|nr:hypothetical protein [Desulfobulbaceae bacterium]
MSGFTARQKKKGTKNRILVPFLLVLVHAFFVHVAAQAKKYYETDHRSFFKLFFQNNPMTNKKIRLSQIVKAAG